MNSITSKKLTANVITILILAACLSLTTFALVWATVSAEDNLFHTGRIKINLNDGKPVIEEHEFLFGPGMTVKKDFFIENRSTIDVWYKLYFDDIEGGLADVLDISVRDGDTVLYEGKINELTKAVGELTDSTVDADIFDSGKTNEIMVIAYMPTGTGNAANYGVGKTAPSIEMGINVEAKQYTYEKDAFDNQYDKQEDADTAGIDFNFKISVGDWEVDPDSDGDMDMGDY